MGNGYKLLVIVIIVTGVSFLGLKIDSGTRVVGVLGCFGFKKIDFFKLFSTFLRFLA